MKDILDEFLEHETGTLVVNLWEECAEACRLMEEVMAQLEARQRHDLKVLRLRIEENRAWAERHRVRGTPAILIFRGGRLVARLRGRIDLPELLRFLEGLGV